MISKFQSLEAEQNKIIQWRQIDWESFFISTLKWLDYVAHQTTYYFVFNNPANLMDKRTIIVDVWPHFRETRLRKYWSLFASRTYHNLFNL